PPTHISTLSLHDALPISDSRGLDRGAHDPERALAVFGRRGDVIGVGRHTVADQLGVDLRATLPRALGLLEDQHAGPLADDEAVRSEEHTSELQSLRHLVC